MKSKKILGFKIFATFLFAVLVFGAFFYQMFGKFEADGFLQPRYLYYGCICLCFLFSFFFIGKSAKKILLTLALGAHVAADYFLILMPTEENKLIGVCVYCGVQFLYFVYTLCLNKGIGTRIVNISTRVALCLVAYFVLPNYFALGTLEIIAVLYILNSLITLLVLLLHVKTEWLTFLGFLLFFACDIVVGLQNGGFTIFQITGPVVDFFGRYDIASYCYVPSVFLIATSSIWAKKKIKD